MWVGPIGGLVVGRGDETRPTSFFLRKKPIRQKKKLSARHYFYRKLVKSFKYTDFTFMSINIIQIEFRKTALNCERFVIDPLIGNTNPRLFDRFCSSESFRL
jgi:hypothetical protein